MNRRRALLGGAMTAAWIGFVAAACGDDTAGDGTTDPRLPERRDSDARNDTGVLEAASGGETGVCPIAQNDTVVATVRMTTDDNYKLYVNGTLIDDQPRPWTEPQTYTVTLRRHPSAKNVLAIEGVNSISIDGKDRGVILDLAYEVGGKTHTVVTDTTWKVTTTLTGGWFDPANGDDGWVAPIDEGAHGVPPWNAILGTSSAHWLWHYDSNEPSTSKPQVDVAYFRRTFYIDRSGTPVTAPPACP